MLKVPSFGMNTCPETFVSFIHCIIDYTLSLLPSHARLLLDAASVHWRHEHDECCKCFHAYVIHPCQKKTF